jgi:hypothetical protein
MNMNGSEHTGPTNTAHAESASASSEQWDRPKFCTGPRPDKHAYRSRSSARVVLPEPEEVDSEEELEEGYIEEDGDFLADFPDETEVRKLLACRWSY